MWKESSQDSMVSKRVLSISGALVSNKTSESYSTNTHQVLEWTYSYGEKYTQRKLKHTEHATETLIGNSLQKLAE